MPIGGVINRNYNVFCFVVDPVLAYFYLYYSIIILINMDRKNELKILF